jgi:hypothetical protein
MLFMLFIHSSGVSQVGASILVDAQVEFFLGCGQLSTLEEQLVLIFTEVRSDDNNRLTVTINQAYKVPISRQISTASMLLNGETEGSEWRIPRSDRDVV